MGAGVTSWGRLFHSGISLGKDACVCMASAPLLTRFLDGKRRITEKDKKYDHWVRRPVTVTRSDEQNVIVVRQATLI